jgi:GNAT superfamily N-acetyltransferase
MRGESPNDPAPFAWIHDVYVKPKHRRRGVASMLMAEAERFARGEGEQLPRLRAMEQNKAARTINIEAGIPGLPMPTRLE